MNQVDSAVKSVMQQIQSIKQLYQIYVNKLTAVPGYKEDWPFSMKLYDAATADIPADEKCFTNFADLTYENFKDFCESAFEYHLDFTKIFTFDNHHGSYFKFNSRYFPIADGDIEWNGSARSIISDLSTQGTIGDYSELEWQDDNTLNTIIMEEDIDWYTDMLDDLSHELSTVVNEIQTDLTEMIKIIDYYTGIKNNQVQNFADYVDAYVSAAEF